MENLFCHVAHSPPSDAYFQTKLFCSAQPIVSFFSFFFKTNNTEFGEVVFLTGEKINLICASGHGAAYILLYVYTWLSFGYSFHFLHILSFKLLEINKLPLKRCRREMYWYCMYKDVLFTVIARARNALSHDIAIKDFIWHWPFYRTVSNRRAN